ncbi:hypothetical protein GCM10010215_74850 [Streptomyces virginiae]|uniref:Uncharacterized protein n=1 Tax=Streptomyces virginiae TaxID=1961 RepID=A0ABQ3NNU6_STRVG|nr:MULTISPECIES: hypothetical protein [Streptomyces]GLV96327.1 hypothetical protein Slala04_77800 [Streptomyces lavendulae subsp. lavendulae]MBP2341677.1 hypothetical protein [Streptomyces virginiae]MCI4079376.1 hypothetical protein [Streptomyces sp. MMS21 TC-5]GGQ40322.1 hypothetical protein GCM10010215_74850 [Streptomyces virginiae]GHI14455.1 hypothetical protein Scinn_39180 [Streptomyces virginiae]
MPKFEMTQLVHDVIGKPANDESRPSSAPKVLFRRGEHERVALLTLVRDFLP